MCVVLKSPKYNNIQEGDEEKSLDDDVIICTQLIKSMEFHNPEVMDRCKNLTTREKFQSKKLILKY